MISEIPFSYQEYLETILRISLKSKDETVKTSEIAKQLKVKAPSVTEMLDKLKSKDLIYYKKRKGVTLTEKGKKLILIFNELEEMMFFILSTGSQEVGSSSLLSSTRYFLSIIGLLTFRLSPNGCSNYQPFL